jgi:glycosyltransferase involved in cell wall biosynthesis
MRSLEHARSLLKRQMFDWSFLPFFCWIMALVSLLRFAAFLPFRRFQSTVALLKAHRLLLKAYPSTASLPKLQRLVERFIGREFSSEGRIHLLLTGNGKVSERESRFFERGLTSFREQRGIVLKAPRLIRDRVVEKGVLFLGANIAFRFFRLYLDATAVLQRYVLVLGPSWSAHARFDILYFTRFTGHPVVVAATERRDYQFLERLGSNLIPVSFGCSDWINPSIFRPLQAEEKLYDAIMVARWSFYKRHHALFRALRDMRDPSFRVALVGLSSPDDRKEAEALIDGYGVGDNVSLFGKLTQEEVNKVLNQSKVNLLLSLQEGGNRCIAEGFFAGVPGLALKNNMGLQKDYFTPQTGKLVAEKDLAAELLFFRDHWSEFDPRPWAEEHIAPDLTAAKLNKLVKSLAHQRGEEWTRDLVALWNDLELKYYPDEQAGRGLPSMGEILTQYARSKEIRDLVSRY